MRPALPQESCPCHTNRPQKLRQVGNIHGNAPRLVLSPELAAPCSSRWDLIPLSFAIAYEQIFQDKFALKRVDGATAA